MKKVSWKSSGSRFLSGLLALVMMLGTIELALPARVTASDDAEQTVGGGNCLYILRLRAGKL